MGTLTSKLVRLIRKLDGDWAQKYFFCALSEASIYRTAFVILYERVYMFTYLFVPNNRQAFENKRVVDLALKSSIPGALLPVLENFRRRFFWPNGPPLGLWECSQQCWMLQNDFKYKKNSQLLLKKFRRKSQTNAFKSFIYRQEKATTSAVRSLRAKTVIVCNSKWVKIIIFVLNNISLFWYN